MWASRGAAAASDNEIAMVFAAIPCRPYRKLRQTDQQVAAPLALRFVIPAKRKREPGS
jgi:hypothetical protein